MKYFEWFIILILAFWLQVAHWRIEILSKRVAMIQEVSGWRANLHRRSN
jgi:hypothetical protein